MNTLFTVVIPTLNEESNISNLLDDLTKQTFKSFKVIIIDANSEDNTVNIAKKYGSTKLDIKVFTSNKRNVASQRNLGAKLSTTDWLIFMDADNRIPPYYLQGLKFHSEMTGADFISTWIEPDSKSNLDKATATTINITIDLSKNTPNPYILESMILVKRKSFEILNGFDENVHWHEGGDLLRRAKKRKMKFEFVKTPKYTYSFRRLRKTGKFSVLQKVIKMELSRVLLNTPVNQKFLYPMEGGAVYQIDSQKQVKLKGLLSELFENKNDLKNNNWIFKLIKNYFVKTSIPTNVF